MAGKEILVTGASGFVGRYLVPALLERGYAVTALGREATRPEWLPAPVRWLSADLREPGSLSSLAPVWGVMHLAGDTVPSQFSAPLMQLDNVAMAIAVAEGLSFGRLLFVSSCHVYAPSAAPLQESSPVRPRGRYGLSKHLAEQVMLAYGERHDIRIARPFNHLGAHMRPELMAPSLLERIRRERGARTPLRMHGLNSTRDFLDVRDITSAYLRILELEHPAERVFNVASGAPRTVSELAAAALALVGDGSREVVFEGSGNSTDDTDYLVGDAARLRTATGWAPRYALAETLRAMLSDAGA